MEHDAALEQGSECASLIIKGIRHRIRKSQTMIARTSANGQTCLHVLFVFLSSFPIFGMFMAAGCQQVCFEPDSGDCALLFEFLIVLVTALLP